MDWETSRGRIVKRESVGEALQVGALFVVLMVVVVALLGFTQ